MAGNPIDELEKYPGMTHWFDPVLLSKLLLKVIVAGLFGQYADRRLLMAALDTVGSDELVKRAGIPGVIPEQGPFWIDYVSDLGDGFDATYAVAYRLAQESVAAGGEELPRGSLLVMGGDEVYPTSERHVYRARLFRPYRLAFPDRKDAPSHPLVFMIPGTTTGTTASCNSWPCSAGRRRRASELADAAAPQLFRDQAEAELVAVGDRHRPNRGHGSAAGRILRGDRQGHGPAREHHPVHRRAGLVRRRGEDGRLPDAALCG